MAYGWSPELVREALGGFSLPKPTDHGVSHWARVRAHGVYLARIYGVNPVLPSMFALFHDCRRHNEYHDPEHGERGAEVVEKLATSGVFQGRLSAQEIGWLMHACTDHSDGHLDGPRAVQVCWDADRLDLGRVGIVPNPKLLCTPAARDPDVIARARRWSSGKSWREETNDEFWSRHTPRQPRFR